MLTLWGRTNSINVQKVIWTLGELDLDYARIDAGMAFGVVDTPEYSSRNPNRLVPTLDDDGYVLWESNTIVRYLAARYGAGRLYPEDLKARFIAEQWMDWQATNLYPALIPAFLGLVRQAPQFSAPATIEAARTKTEGFLAVLDAHLGANAFVAGEAFTMADIPAGASAWRWAAMPIAHEPRPNIARWLESLRGRPGFAGNIDLPLS